MFSLDIMDNSKTFEETKLLLRGFKEWWDILPDFPYASYFHDTAYWAIIIILLYFIFVFLRN